MDFQVASEVQLHQATLHCTDVQQRSPTRVQVVDTSNYARVPAVIIDGFCVDMDCGYMYREGFMYDHIIFRFDHKTRCSVDFVYTFITELNFSGTSFMS